MDSMGEIFIERADNEILAAESLKKLSEEATAKSSFKIPKETTSSMIVNPALLLQPPQK